jgi:uncharacterized membrane protein
MVAVAMVVLLGMAGLAIDVGHVFYCDRSLQGYADAAALAGGGSMRTATSSAAVVASANFVQRRPGSVNAQCLSAKCNHGEWVPLVEVPDHIAESGNRVPGLGSL